MSTLLHSRQQKSTKQSELLLKPRMSSDGFFTAVTVIIQQLLVYFEVSGSQEDEVRFAVDLVQLGPKIAVLTVVDQPAQTVGFFSSIHTRIVHKQLYTVSNNFRSSGLFIDTAMFTLL